MKILAIGPGASLSTAHKEPLNNPLWALLLGQCGQEKSTSPTRLYAIISPGAREACVHAARAHPGTLTTTKCYCSIICFVFQFFNLLNLTLESMVSLL